MKKFFSNPSKALTIFIGVSLFLWTLQCSLTQSILPLDVIETIVWGGQWQWGQYKHPPLSGWLGYLFSWLSIHSDWSLYLLAQLCVACCVFFVYRLARKFFNPFGAAVACLLLFSLHYYTPPAMKFCSHDVESALMPGMVYFFYCAIQENKIRHWIGFSIISAAAFLGKYAAAQLFPACLIIMLITPEGRARFKEIGVYFSGILFLLLLLPHFIWLKNHDFCSIRHLDERMGQEQDPWFQPLIIILVIIYPFIVEWVILFLSSLPYRKKQIKKSIHWESVIWSMLFTLIPCFVYLGISLSGGHVILPWFSYLATMTGIAVVGLFHVEIDWKIFRNIYVLMCIVTLIALVGSTIDMLLIPRLRLHANPRDFTQAAEQYYATKNSNKIAVVVSMRWEAGVIENYLPYRPKACALDDPCNLELVRKTIKENGALLFTDSESRFKPFFKQIGSKPVVFDGKVTIQVKAASGRAKTYHYLMGYLPPQKD